MSSGRWGGSKVELVAVSVGNTRTRVGAFRGRELISASAVVNSDIEAVASAVREAAATLAGAAIVMASVNPPMAERLRPMIDPKSRGGGGELFVLGADLDIPIVLALDDASTVGQDRLLNGLAAFIRAGQACIVVDCGTAVTVDFVDGTGVFQGGAIAPGVSAMLAAMHDRTAKLPEVGFEVVPMERPFGKSTAEAMRLGVQSAVHGMVRVLAERYAEAYGAYPQIIATGGDAGRLFDGDEVIEHVVPELTLMGIQAACERVLTDDEDGDA